MIVVQTQITPEDYRNYCRFNRFKGSGFRKFGFYVLPFISVLLLMLRVLEGDADISLPIVLLAASIMLLIMPRIAENKMMKSSNLMFSTRSRYQFSGDEIFIVQQSDTTESTTHLEYAKLSCGYESSDVFYLYLSLNQAHLLPKRDIIEGTPEQLRALLEEKMGEKFKVRMNLAERVHKGEGTNL